jgi:hypothetical protein
MAETERNVLLVGSIGLPDVETVFRSLAGTVGGSALRFPDGECGPRSHWIMWQLSVIAGNDQFEIGETIEIPFGGSVRKLDKYKIVGGVDAGDIAFEELGYAREAISSYASFKRLQDAGTIPAATRFQVSLPTPVAVVTQHFLSAYQADVEPAYERAMAREVTAIVDAIPGDDLSIQWDVCQEVLAADDAWQVFYGDLVGDALERLVRLSGLVPEPCELGFHFCYGDPGHKHLKEPGDLGVCVVFANGVCEQIGRIVNWIHMPVPKERDDDAYFAPLDDIKLQAGTELYLGLVHITDGLDGAKRRLAAATQHVEHFGVATECGFGRRQEDTIPELLRLHADIAEL